MSERKMAVAKSCETCAWAVLTRDDRYARGLESGTLICCLGINRRDAVRLMRATSSISGAHDEAERLGRVVDRKQRCSAWESDEKPRDASQDPNKDASNDEA